MAFSYSDTIFEVKIIAYNQLLEVKSQEYLASNHDTIISI